jgi:DNA-binding response OmpR family regulator
MPPTPLLVDLNTNIITDGKTSVRLYPLQAVLADTLIRRMPSVVSHDQLFTALWGGNADRTHGALKAHICHLQIVMDEFGFAIEPNYGFGYRLISAEAVKNVISQSDLRKRRKSSHSKSAHGLRQVSGLEIVK